MFDPERGVEMEETFNENPMYDNMDSISRRFPSPKASLTPFSTSYMPPSPKPGFSEWDFPNGNEDGNPSSSTPPLVCSPSPPSRELFEMIFSEIIFHRLSRLCAFELSNHHPITWYEFQLEEILVQELARLQINSGTMKLEEMLVQEFARLHVKHFWNYETRRNLKLLNFQEVQEILVQELARLHIQNRYVYLTMLFNQICKEGHDNASIEILDKIIVVADTFKLHFSWTEAPCRHHSLAYGGDLKKSCTSFDGCYMHKDCMSTAKLGIYVEHHIERGQGLDERALSSHSPFFYREHGFKIQYPLVHYARKIGSQRFNAICEPIASAEDQSDSRCELNHISQSTKFPPGANGLPDGEVMLQQDSLKHLLVGGNHAMNDGENVLSEGGIHSAVSYPENEGTRKISKKEGRKVRKKITQEDLQHFPGSRKDAAKTFEVSVATIKRYCRDHGITDWRYRKIDKNNQSLSKPKDIIVSVHSEGAKMENQMPGGSRSCERELNHEQIGFPPESEKGLDRSQIGVGLMEERSTQMMEISPAGDMFVSSTHDQCVEAGDPLELPVQPSELNLARELLIDHYISATEAFNTEQVPESSWTNLLCSYPAPKLAEATTAHMTTLVTETETRDSGTVTMKATYREDMIRFQLSFTSGIIELRKEVAKRLMLEVDTFSIKYLDDDEDWILMTGDKDLWECFHISVSLGHKVIKLSIHDITPS